MKILIAGDFCPQYRVSKKIESGDFESVLGEFKSLIFDADYSIVNFECPVTYGGEKPIVKCGPNLQCTEKGLEAVKWAGFNCVTLANNHFLDYGRAGVENTLEACARFGIDTVGGGSNLREASATFYKKIDDSVLAIINCCEHEFSVATQASAGSNPLNPIQQFYAIKEARNKADYVLVIVHGGHEHYQLPSPRMQEVYRFFIDAGASAVINHHQHCYSGYEVYKGKPIFYGLGNFCFDKPGNMYESWNEGFVVTLDMKSQDVIFAIHPYIQCNEEPHITLFSQSAFDEHLNKLNRIISDDKMLKEAVEKYYKSLKHLSRNVLNPVTNRYLRSLQCRNLLPDFISEKWLKVMHNHLMCEAHRDRLLYYLNHRNEK